MPNNYFQFKQFTVQQERAALKVSTDSCLFGAWAAEELRRRKEEIRRVLDIGAGSGLLMFMLAQKCNAVIDGIEIDGPSFQQATANSEESPWKNRLHIFHADVKEFQFQQQYDFIISNPPFYEGDLKPGASNRNIAMHDEGLKLDELLQVTDQCLSEDGSFAVLLPYHRAEQFITSAANHGLFLSVRVNVRQTVNHTFFRTMLLLRRVNETPGMQELSIKDQSNQYTESFTELLRDYYLYL